jgi:neopullulanase
MKTLPLLLLACTDKVVEPGRDSDQPATEGLCPVSFEVTLADEADSVSIVGDWNRWEEGADPLSSGASPGLWTGVAHLPPGSWSYRISAVEDWTVEGYERLLCDPHAELIHCPEDYKEPWATDWSHACATPAETACNSMIVVPDCTAAAPELELLSLQIDRAAGVVSVELALLGEGELAATLDGTPVELERSGDRASLQLAGLSPTRHTLRVKAASSSGEADPLYIPFWMDGVGEAPWRQAPVYFAFVDRLANGDSSIDASEGVSLELGDYLGGDFQGVIDSLDYLEELGVGTLWLSNPQDNADGGWAGDCDHSYSGYHAYWPIGAREVEPHFGDEEALRRLVQEAHARNMRVIMDFVANHVHQDHPLYLEHADEGWFNDQAICEDSWSGQSNWDRIPEQCWFAPYLPDINYAEPDALTTMVDDALWWVKTFELDGLRVDAVKHMPHSLSWNLEARLRAEVEHRGAGGDEVFWTVGETFDGHERIAAYISREAEEGDKLQLDGQFDFPQYYALLSVFASASGSMSELSAAVSAGEGYWQGALMSGFLGNHDVVRFATYGAEGYRDSCEEGVGMSQASDPLDSDLLDRMAVAWTFLYSQPSVPLIYYGDEIAMGGYSDPDNRHPLWWSSGGDGSAPASLEALASQVDPDRAVLLRHIAELASIRRQHPAMWRGEAIEWWMGPSDWPTLWGYARRDPETGNAVVVLLNMGWTTESLTNGLAFAGLPEGTYEELLSGGSSASSGDSITLSVGPRSSAVWAWQGDGG